MGWARQPYHYTIFTVTTWDWLPEWFSGFSHNFITIFCSSLLIFAIMLRLASNKILSGAEKKFPYLLVLMPICGIAYWFFSAPDIRFGEGYFWSLPILFLVIVIINLRIYSSLKPGKIDLIKFSVNTISTAVLLCLLILTAAGTLSPTTSLWKWPEIKEPETEVQYTLEGYKVHIPVGSDQCWLSELPCTPELKEKLRIRFNQNGSPDLFTLAAD